MRLWNQKCMTNYDCRMIAHNLEEFQVGVIVWPGDWLTLIINSLIILSKIYYHTNMVNLVIHCWPVRPFDAPRFLLWIFELVLHIFVFILTHVYLRIWGCRFRHLQINLYWWLINLKCLALFAWLDWFALLFEQMNCFTSTLYAC